MSSPAGHCSLQGEVLSTNTGLANLQLPVLFTRLDVVDIQHNGVLTWRSVYFIFELKGLYLTHRLICIFGGLSIAFRMHRDFILYGLDQVIHGDNIEHFCYSTQYGRINYG